MMSLLVILQRIRALESHFAIWALVWIIARASEK